ncbi:MAG: argininosuccinate lyase [Elusimicrobiota bacterium]
MKSIRDFVASVSFDMRLVEYDIIGSIAHAKMLAKCRIIPAAEGRKIIRGLESIKSDILRGKKIRLGDDVHFTVEAELIRRIGPVGGKLHTARSRNDQIALDVRLYVRDEIINIYGLVREFQRALVTVSEVNKDAVMPGYTHLQPAQPVLFAHALLSFAWMLQRDAERLSDCLKRVNVMPLGSAALAGTSFPIDRKYIAKLLGFCSVTENSMDAVSDRDFMIETLSALSIISMHLSRLSEQLIIWQSWEFAFVRIHDEFTTGSSIMPQKRNPDVLELVRGKTGRVFGSLAALLTIMKGLPLTYNSDMQEDKPPVFDAIDTVKDCLEVMTPLVGTLKINKTRMFTATEHGYMEATELADYLTKKGIPFRQAHGIVAGIVKHCAKSGKRLEDLRPSELAGFSSKFNPDVRRLLHPENIVKAKSSEGGTSPSSVEKQIKAFKQILK